MLLLVVVHVASAASACSHSSRRAATQASPRWCWRTRAGEQHVKVEIARTDPERQRGLMYRQKLEPGAA